MTRRGFPSPYDPMSAAAPDGFDRVTASTANSSTVRSEPGPRIGVLTNRNLASPWASTHYYAANALARAGARVEHVAAKHLRRSSPSGSLGGWGRWLGGKAQTLDLPAFESAVLEDLSSNQYDAVIALHSSFVASALEEARCPVIYVTDATADLLQGYYPSRTDLTEDYARAVEEGERRAIDRADRVCVPTGWVAESVVSRYHASPQKVAVVPWGANLDSFPNAPPREPIDAQKPVDLLFVGLDWRRKGGDVAVRAADALREDGVSVVLNVVGGDLPPELRRPYVVTHGRLSRADSGQSAKLDRLMMTADFLIHPARAECYGHVLCEALAFGLPVLTTDTGGIPECVDDGATGVLLSPGSSGSEYAAVIRRLRGDGASYVRMSEQARHDFRTRLNWDRWSSGVLDLVLELRPSPSDPK